VTAATSHWAGINAQAQPATISERVAALDWNAVAQELNAHGCASAGALLAASECKALASAYSREEFFRSRIVMARHSFGRGEYKYFAYPLPATVAELREALYPKLAEIANARASHCEAAPAYPPHHADFLATCHRAGQIKPTALLLRYEAGDYNCLHQDLYGEHVFPLQVVIPCSRPGVDFIGG
jgi:hypothetical protein